MSAKRTDTLLSAKYGNGDEIKDRWRELLIKVMLWKAVETQAPNCVWNPRRSQ